MLNRFLSQSVKFDRVMVSQAAATSDATSDSIDMTGYRGVCFIITLGTLSSSQVTNGRAQTSSNDSAWNDLEGGSTPAMADTDDDLIVVIDIYKPLERYLRVIVDRATGNAEIDSVLAIMYDPVTEVTTQPADVADIERHLSPAEGTT